MSVLKTPISLIQVLDSEGKVTNLEIEFRKTYAGDDPDIAKGFIPAVVREEVTPEEFAKYIDNANSAAVAAVQELRELNAKLQEQAAAAKAEQAAEAQAHEAIATQLRADAINLTAQVDHLKARLAAIAKAAS